MTRKVIKDTKYCQILSQGKLADAEYTYCIEKIFIKAIKKDEIHFSIILNLICKNKRKK
ncbi:hypothetical protein [Clostridium sp.]|uniref:hypothetical protein n=1 Tax=Clostridium sp. TaxID=1506 RepID=UPI003216BA1B